MYTFAYVLFQFVIHMCTNVFKMYTNVYVRIQMYANAYKRTHFLQKYVKNSHFL